MKKILLILTSLVYITTTIVAIGLGELSYKAGMKSYKDKNYSDAITFFSKACDLDYSKGCTGLSSLYIEELGVKRDFTKITVLSNKACQLKDGQGCFDMAFMFEHGYGKKKDLKKAKYFYIDSCNYGNKKGCYNLGLLSGLLAEDLSDVQMSVKYYRLACEYGSPRGCKAHKELLARGIKESKSIPEKQAWENQDKNKFIETCTQDSSKEGCYCMLDKIIKKYPSVLQYADSIKTYKYKQYLKSMANKCAEELTAETRYSCHGSVVTTINKFNIEDKLFLTATNENDAAIEYRDMKNHLFLQDTTLRIGKAHLTKVICIKTLE
jgi:hypothetical protein